MYALPQSRVNQSVNQWENSPYPVICTRQQSIKFWGKLIWHKSILISKSMYT